jgi:hypothetical protein
MCNQGHFFRLHKGAPDYRNRKNVNVTISQQSNGKSAVNTIESLEQVTPGVAGVSVTYLGFQIVGQIRELSVLDRIFVEFDFPIFANLTRRLPTYTTSSECLHNEGKTKRRERVYRLQFLHLDRPFSRLFAAILAFAVGHQLQQQPSPLLASRHCPEEPPGAIVNTTVLFGLAFRPHDHAGANVPRPKSPGPHRQS